MGGDDRRGAGNHAAQAGEGRQQLPAVRGSGKPAGAETYIAGKSNLKFLLNVVVLFRVEWCIRQLCCSSILLYHITSIAHDICTDIYPLLNIQTFTPNSQLITRLYRAGEIDALFVDLLDESIARCEGMEGNAEGLQMMTFFKKVVEQNKAVEMARAQQDREEAPAAPTLTSASAGRKATKAKEKPKPAAVVSPLTLPTVKVASDAPTTAELLNPSPAAPMTAEEETQDKLVQVGRLRYIHTFYSILCSTFHWLEIIQPLTLLTLSTNHLHMSINQFSS